MAFITLDDIYALWIKSRLKCTALGLDPLKFEEFCECKKMLGYEII